jgi:hypothetical protein
MKDKDSSLNYNFNKGLISSYPKTNYSSGLEICLAKLLGFNVDWPKKHLHLEYNFNLETPLKIDTQTFYTVHARDADKPPAAPNCCYSFTKLTRWRLDISSFATFDDYLNSLIRWHYCNYLKSKKQFQKSNCTVEYFDSGWEQHVDEVYRLYLNVAAHYVDKLYDLNFFRLGAQRGDYKLICAWHEGKMIGLFVLHDEGKTLHSICCGFDYEVSSASYAYSWLNYELVRFAIEAKKYRQIDVGFTADNSKKLIGLKPIPSRLDFYVNNSLLRGVLKLLSKVVATTLTQRQTLKFSFKR